MPDSEARVILPPRPWRQALLWLAFLGPFFFASYGFANWLASHRGTVGAIVFDWEGHIPFAAWTIVPYWSIDILYGLSLFVCVTRRELDVHGRRLLCAQFVCISCFLAFPLRFTFPRPDTGGIFGLMFDALMGFDKPFNQAPSLHIALLVILWVLYGRHVPRRWRWILHGWFALIGVSVLTTYQHHFIDLPTGFWVGWLCVWLFPEQGRSLLTAASLTTDPRRRALAMRYGLGALASGAVAIHFGGAAVWLLWGSGSLALVAVIYAFFGETAFQKEADGSMGAAAWWLFGPYFLGAWLNARWWTRSTAGADPVVPGLLLGRLPTRKDREAHGARAVVDLTAELPCAAGGTRYVNVPVLDLVPLSTAQIERSVAAIDGMFADGPVLVCCALGFSRSATAVAAWLTASGRAVNLAEAIGQVRRVRPGVVLDASHIVALERFAGKRTETIG
jgi:protein-tyrosine phosphatase